MCPDHKVVVNIKPHMAQQVKFSEKEKVYCQSFCRGAPVKVMKE